MRGLLHGEEAGAMMKLRWLWRLCPCRRCHGHRINRAYVEVLLRDMRETTGAPEPRINMPKLLALVLEVGFIKKPDEFAERKNYVSFSSEAINHGTRNGKSYSYGVFKP